MIDPVQAEWLKLLHAPIPNPPGGAGDDLLARQLAGYRCLVDSWEEALQVGRPDAPGHALRALARHVQEQCLGQIRAWLSAGPTWDAVARLPLPPVAPAVFLAVPGGAQGLTLWCALQGYQREVDRFCALYQSLGADTLARIEAVLEAPAAPRIESVAALYALWQSCQDACEASIVRGDQYALRLAAVASAVAALRAAHHQWCVVMGVAHDSGAQRALSEEIAAIRRQLRATKPGPRRAGH